MNTDLLNAVAEYISVLSASLEKTEHPQDRSAYEQHLGAATSILESIRQSNFPGAFDDDREDARGTVSLGSQG